MEPLISVIILWLSLTFAFPTAPERPQVRHVPPQHLTSIRFGGVVGAGHDQNVLGAYDARSQTVFLRDDWDSRNAADVSVLVHELVHFLQDRASWSYECPGEREALAYEAQQRWLQLFGKSLEGAFDLDAMTLKLRTACLPY
jgi:hypothetical protein